MKAEKKTKENLINEITELRKRISELEEDDREKFRQLRMFAAHLQSVQEEERTRIAREIHDELSQTLTMLQIDLADFVSELNKKDPKTHAPFIGKVAAISKAIGDIIEVGHRIAREMRPSILDDLGFMAAAEWQINEFRKKTGMKCEFNKGHIIAFNKEFTTALFRILQEALSNVARHAGATEVIVDIYMKDGSVILKVEDNGKGIEERKISDGHSLGLLGMRERVTLLSGELSIYSKPGEGTAVIAYIPVGRHAL
ncbi:MAG: sensor histidine kinase [Nitrospirae bacterium]|nr:sensor histidine kinase [Nitrospirota bacterium]MCL5978451.1 sensor histidine kinase [Nitrospirota bacterium]